jgi:flagellin
MTGVKMGKVLEKLSSGYRINRAADDAAGLGISEKMRAQIRGNTQAIRNANDGISMIQTAEGAMDEVHSILQRMRELGVQAANDTNDGAARTSIGTELVQLRDEIDRIANATQFNGQSLLTGTLSGTLGGVTANDLVVNNTLTNATNTTASAIEVGGAAQGTFKFQAVTGVGNDIILTGPTGLAQKLTVAAFAGAGSQTLNFDKLGVSVTLTSVGADTAANIVLGLLAAADDTIVVTGTGAAQLQVGANTTIYDKTSITFSDTQATTAGGLNLLTNAGVVDWTSSATIVSTNSLASGFINQVDAAITRLNTRRADLGASQNRLEHTINSLGVSVENLTASESRIRDADIAGLSSQMVSNQILQQAGTAVLSQANQSSQSVLTLLRQ